MAEVKHRKHSAPYLALRIVRGVWSHPNNRSNRLRAVGRSLSWQVRKRSNPRPTVRTVYGSMHIWMDPRFGSVSNLVYFGDRFDVDEMDFMSRYLRPGDRFLDVGANIGTYSLLAASLIGAGGSIDAVEAVPELTDGLRRNVALNQLDGIMRVHQVAVSDHDGELRFRADRDVSSRIANTDDPDNAVTIVPCSQLDHLIPPGPIALMKIDVEGAEVSALRGFASHLASANPPVMLMEILPHMLDRLGESMASLASLLDAHGYTTAMYSADSGQLEVHDGRMVDGNMVVVSRSHLDEIRERLDPTQ